MENRNLKIVAKTGWKKVTGAEMGLDPEFMSGFIDFEELTDYQLVDDDSRKRKSEEPDTVKKSKRAKVKLAGKANVDTPVQNSSIRTPKQLSKKKKTKKRPKEPELETAEAPEQEVPVGLLRNGDNSKEMKDIKVAQGKKEKKCSQDPTVEIENKQLVNSDEDILSSVWRQYFVPDPLVHALLEQGFTAPTKIQQEILPSAIRDRRDVVGAAETGSGKTLAFGLPIVTHILSDREEEMKSLLKEASEEVGFDSSAESSKPKRNTKLRALVVTPTRELAIQVRNHLIAVCKHTPLKICVVVGGLAVEKQARLLKRCPDIVIGTPGRLWELIEEGNDHLSQVTNIKYLVIDEADRMVEKGHFEELLQLLNLINGENNDNVNNEKRQTFLFSATLTMIHNLPVRVLKKKKKKLVALSSDNKLDRLFHLIGVRNKPKVVDITRKLGTAETLTEAKISCSLKDKDVYLFYLVSLYPGKTLVFCNSIDCVRRLSNIFRFLQQNPYCLHASMQQRQRLKNLDRFAADKKGLLLATDVAARGLDIPNVDHVIHYQVPRTSEAYVHRSGRTARALKEGLSIMIVDPNDVRSYRKICKSLNRDGDLQSFPVDLTTLRHARERVQLALQLDKLEHSSRKAHSENNWLTKAAAEMDIELDDQEYSNDIKDEKKLAELKREMNGLQKRLSELLKFPISTKSKLVHPRIIGVNLGKMMMMSPQEEKVSSNALTQMKEEKEAYDKLLTEFRKKMRPHKTIQKNNKKQKKKRK